MRRRMEINHHRTYRGKAAVFLLVTAALLAGCANERTEDELSYRKIGIESMQSGDYEGALAAFDGALACCTGKITGLEIDITRRQPSMPHRTLREHLRRTTP